MAVAAAAALRCSCSIVTAGEGASGLAGLAFIARFAMRSIDIPAAAPASASALACGMGGASAVSSSTRPDSGSSAAPAYVVSPSDTCACLCTALPVRSGRSTPSGVCSSTLYCWEQWLQHEVFLPSTAELQLHQLYFAMDFLEDHKSEIEKAVYFATADLMNADVDVIFYDTTSFGAQPDQG